MKFQTWNINIKSKLYPVLGEHKFAHLSAVAYGDIGHELYPSCNEGISLICHDHAHTYNKEKDNQSINQLINLKLWLSLHWNPRTPINKPQASWNVKDSLRDSEVNDHLLKAKVVAPADFMGLLNGRFCAKQARLANFSFHGLAEAGFLLKAVSKQKWSLKPQFSAWAPCL